MMKKPHDIVKSQDKAKEQGRPMPSNTDAVVNQTVRPDPQPKDDTLPSSNTIPAHAPNDIEGVIQEKAAPGAPIKERLPNEQDLQEGKITPQAVHKPDPNEPSRYEGGVTQEDIDHGRISPAAVRERSGWSQGEREKAGVSKNDDLSAMITFARNATQLSRLTYNELLTCFHTLEDNGFKVSKS